MGEKKKHGEKMSIDINTKEELLAALHKEESKPADELDTDEISRITKLLEQMDEDKHLDISDYDEFLQRFNDRNNTNLTSSTKKRKYAQGSKVIYMTIRRKGGLVAAAMLLIVLVISNTSLSTASIHNTKTSWVTGEGLDVVFHVGNTKYESFVEKDEDVKYVPGYSNIIEMQIADYTTTDINDIDKYNILIPTYYPDRYEFRDINVTDYESFKLNIDFSFNANKDDYLSYDAWLYNSENGESSFGLSKDSITEYIGTIRINDFNAYIYQEKEKLEARFCYDGIIYHVIGVVSYDELCDILEGLSYPE